MPSPDGNKNTTDGISTCTVVYTPAPPATCTATLCAYCSGAHRHPPSFPTRRSSDLVDTRSTTTSVDCQEPAVVGQDRTCTVTVTDTQSAGTKSDPSGTVKIGRAHVCTPVTQ